MKERCEVRNGARIHYLDHACFGRPARRTLKVVVRAMRSAREFHGPGTRQTLSLLEAAKRARNRVARFIHADPSNVLLVENTTSGLGWIASSLPLKSGDNVLLADTEFLGAAIVWRQVCRRQGVELVLVRTERGRVLPEHFAASANSRTRAIMVSTVQEVSGFRVNLPALRDVAMKCGAVVIADGIQEAGAIPIDVSRRPVDAYCAGGHKWLRSPFGVGFTYVSSQLLDRLEPPFSGYLALQDPDMGWERYMGSPERTPFDPLPLWRDARRLGTGGFPNWLGAVSLDEAIGQLEEVGAEEVWKRIRRLRDRLADGLIRLGLEIVAHTNEEPEKSGIVCFRLPGGVEAEQALLAALTRARVYLSLRYVSGVGGLRASVHEDNRPGDVDELLEVTSRYLNGQG